MPDPFSDPRLLGAAIVGLPAILVAWGLFARRMLPVYWFVVALIVVGLGYLTATGATGDIARVVVPTLIALAR